MKSHHTNLAMKHLLIPTVLAVTLSLTPDVRAQISVPAGGTGPLSLAVWPPAAEWSTRSLAGGDPSFTSPAGLDAAVATNRSSGITARLGDGLGAAAPAANASAVWTSAGGGYLQTRPTGNGATLLMATLRNDSGGDASALDLSYDLLTGGTALVEQVPGHRVYYSLTGASNSWAVITELSDGVPGFKSHTVLLSGNWSSGSLLYLLWADDNAPNGTDQGFQIDNPAFVASTIFVPLNVTLTAPPDGQLLVAPVDTVDVTVSAIAGGTAPATSVSFFTNSVLFSTLPTPPYTAELIALPAGNYTIQALAENEFETVASAISTIKIRPQFADYTGGTFVEDFDVMGSTGMETPVGWYAGSNPAATTPAPGVAAIVGDGNAGPDGAIHAWNYGLPGDGNRALGTAPTAADRNTVLRLRNLTSSNLVSFQIFYDGEVWRPNTNIIEALTNFVSFDRGSNWIATGFNFVSPIGPMNPTFGIDGHDPANRIAHLGGTVTPPTPVPPGGIIYVRWLNFNEANTDGAMAIDNFSFTGTSFSDATSISFSLTSPTNGQTFASSCGSGLNVTANASASFFVTNVSFRLDGGTAVNDASAPFSATFPGVAPGAHTLTATARDSFGVVSNRSAAFTVLANQAPSVTFNNVFSGASTGFTFLVGTPLTNQFSVSDPDGTVATVEFLVNGTPHFATNASFSHLVVNNALAGASTFTVRATDNCGAVGQQSVSVLITNPPFGAARVIVSNGSPWKYFSSTMEPPLSGGLPWNDPFYDDSTWGSGLAELGRGDAVSPPNTAPERTLIDIGPGTARYRAAYFRHTFSVGDPAKFSSLIVHSLQDDGSAVYLNGTLVATFHMTNGVGVPITYNDFAGPFLGAPAAIGHDGTVYASSNITAALLPGQNCLAVEVHQNTTTSSDLSFDLMLWGTLQAGPPLSITSDGTFYTVTWDDALGEYRLQQSTDRGNPANWTDVPGDPFSPYSSALSSGPAELFFRLIRRF
jgi:hypothetical protein